MEERGSSEVRSEEGVCHVSRPRPEQQDEEQQTREGRREASGEGGCRVVV